MNLHKGNRLHDKNTGYAGPVSIPGQGGYNYRDPVAPLPAGCDCSAFLSFQGQNVVNDSNLLDKLSYHVSGHQPDGHVTEYRNYVPISIFNKICRSASNCGAKALPGFVGALATKNKNSKLFQYVMGLNNVWHAQCINTGIMQHILNNTKEEVEMERIKRFFKEEEGVTAIEYGLIAAIVAVGIIAILGTLKDGLIGTFQAVADEMP